MNKRETILRKHFKELKKTFNFLSVRDDQNKIINGEETNIKAITFYFSEKKSEKLLLLAGQKIIPKEIEGILTDVVEFSSPDFKLGRTSVGDLPPHLQRRLMGVMKDE